MFEEKKILFGEKNSYGQTIKLQEGEKKVNLIVKSVGIIKKISNYENKMKLDIIPENEQDIEYFYSLDNFFKKKANVNNTVKWYGLITKNIFDENIVRLKITKYTIIKNVQNKLITKDLFYDLVQKDNCTIKVGFSAIISSLFSVEKKDTDEHFSGLNIYLYDLKILDLNIKEQPKQKYTF